MRLRAPSSPNRAQSLRTRWASEKRLASSRRSFSIATDLRRRSLPVSFSSARLLIRLPRQLVKTMPSPHTRNSTLIVINRALVPSQNLLSDTASSGPKFHIDAASKNTSNSDQTQVLHNTSMSFLKRDFMTFLMSGARLRHCRKC
ncbi:Isocitrate lyase [Pseudomonas syringae pv. actinidiae]|uniref:Isocitrate lyase n=1 Tax=Pseudomonas syringae pv. actinidiae TaxID=103796 RepID=A0A2V0QQD5_PSESF|nr:Isocitrate lyase [Pseudomonas syringae pv. actinidiae]